MQNLAEIGVIGGSGFYSLLDDAREHIVETPYGEPSDAIAVGVIGDVRVAFLPRHGKKHQYPPHRINYRANLWALKSLGVRRVLGPSAAGSLQPHVRPGDFVVCDQFVDRTSGRTATYFDGPSTVHVSAAEPYCAELRPLAAEVCREAGITVHAAGTVVVIEGPRFSTRAESRWFSAAGWEVINMTQYPEVILARELELCYVNVSLITDFDVGLEGQDDVPTVTVDEVIKVFQANNERLKDVLVRLIPRIPRERGCACGQALEGAVLS
ncbi:MAG: S-methyl-5'-thioadenosine phosphorylase [Chloroflexota bacterium]